MGACTAIYNRKIDDKDISKISNKSNMKIEELLEISKRIGIKYKHCTHFDVVINDYQRKKAQNVKTERTIQIGQGECIIKTKNILNRINSTNMKINFHNIKQSSSAYGTQRQIAHINNDIIISGDIKKLFTTQKFHLTVLKSNHQYAEQRYTFYCGKKHITNINNQSDIIISGDIKKSFQIQDLSKIITINHHNTEHKSIAFSGQKNIIFKSSCISLKMKQYSIQRFVFLNLDRSRSRTSPDVYRMNRHWIAMDDDYNIYNPICSFTNLPKGFKRISRSEAKNYSKLSTRRCLSPSCECKSYFKK